MKKEEFNILMGGLDDRIAACEETIGKIKTTADLEALSIAEARNVRNFCIKELRKMTKVVMVELYHIIGMGNLTATQTAAFTKGIKNYLEFRPFLKCISSGLLSLDDIPQIPVRTKYKLDILAGFTLTHGTDGPEVEDIADVSDYSGVKGCSSVPYQLDGKTITVFEDQLEDFFKFGPKFGGTAGELSMLRYKIDHNGEYWGIKWAGITDGKITGVVTSPRVYTKLRDILTAE